MKKLTLMILAAVLAGCAAPGVVSSSERTVVVRTHVQDYAGAQKLANTECAKHERFARLAERPGPTTAEFIFDCVK